MLFLSYMARHGVVSLVFIVLLLTGGVAGAATGKTAPAIDPDDVVLRVAVTETGTAHWQVEYRTRLDDENSTQAFENLQQEIQQNSTTYREKFANRMGRTVADAETTTGREMAVRNVTVNVSREQLPQEYGVVTYRFTWTDFATANGTHLQAGDALAGLFLDDETTLVVSWTEAFQTADISPQPDDRSDRAVIWRGPTDFGDGEPRVYLERATTGQEGAGTDPPGGADRFDPLHIGVGVVFVFTMMGGAVVVYRNRQEDGSAIGEATGDTDSPQFAQSDELLSNEEQVLELIEQRGGRIKQAEVADELGWTAAKTSQVTKRLREDGELEAFRLGRENVLQRSTDSST